MTTSKTREQILQKAGEVFAAKGFKDGTVREICSLADVNLAAVNYHFGDKERLYIEAVKHARRLIEESVPLPQLAPDLSGEERLTIFVNTFVRRLLHQKTAPWQHQLLVREIMEPSQACEEMVHESFGPFYQILLSAIEDMMPTDTPAHIMQKLGLSIVSQCVFYRAHASIVSMLIPKDVAQHFHPESVAEHIIRFSLAAIHSYDKETISCHED